MAAGCSSSLILLSAASRCSERRRIYGRAPRRPQLTDLARVKLMRHGCWCEARRRRLQCISVKCMYTTM
ncbi:hypothetical protein EJB05_32887 [Eragrostis curvula]|uniref:Uncharacterized protein n=1 Tax=Eragrostis curvula TaxID=38414 RepID=A0A5J9U061_9POAL|nr:hypothetical protein EJB05_32887 [Eragrostis curvula]